MILDTLTYSIAVVVTVLTFVVLYLSISGKNTKKHKLNHE